MPALYRTYRPRRFSEIVGQQHIVQTLRNAVQKGQPAHAYLFCGGRGLGKTTVARVLARALNCLEIGQNAEACLKCRTCLEIDAGSFLDLLEVDAASNTGVDNVRSLIETVRFQPTSGKYKVYIVDEVHMLSKGAWNAFLKTLEEPPPGTVFVLATTESSKVPATINSRAQRFDFHKFSETELKNQLSAVLAQEGRVLDQSVIDLVAHSAQGGMRDALTVLDQVLALGESPGHEEVLLLLGVTSEQALAELLRIIQEGNAAAIPEFFTSLATVTFDMQGVARDMLELLRELLSYKLSGQVGALVINIKELTELFTESELLFLIRQFLRGYKEVSQSPDPSLPLLVASMEAAIKFADSASSQGANRSARTAALHSANITSAQSKQDTHASKPAQESGMESVGEIAVKATLPSVDEVKASWPAVCDKLKEVNGPLATLVRNSPVCGIEGNTIALGVKYLFHKEQLEAIKSRQMVSQAIMDVLGVAASVSAQFIEREESETDSNVVLSDALRVFGGELVE